MQPVEVAVEVAPAKARIPDLAAELRAARQMTLDLLAPLSDEELSAQHSPLMSPLVWDLAHIGWYEELWLLRNAAGRETGGAGFDEIYDAFGNPRSDRPSLPLLGPAEARAFCADVRARVLESLNAIELAEDDPLLADGFVYSFVAQHEHQHNETMAAALQLRDAPYPCPPAPATARAVASGEVLIDGGSFVMGTNNVGTYDNERREFETDIPPFLIDVAPVTNGAYLEFIRAGGYDEQAAWSEPGWAHRQSAGLEHPLFWQREGDGSWSRRRFGMQESIGADEPVQHVSWSEADAFARWAGKRLPSEAEWEKAASWDAAAGVKRPYPWGNEWSASRANLERQQFQPAAVGSYPDGMSPAGCHQMIGDVWEWTSTDFAGYPHFEAFPYPEYSEAFFGTDYKVLRGGSWATHPTVARTTFRNWDYPIRRQIFAGFRCARSPDD